GGEAGNGREVGDRLGRESLRLAPEGQLPVGAGRLGPGQRLAARVVLGQGGAQRLVRTGRIGEVGGGAPAAAGRPPRPPARPPGPPAPAPWRSSGRPPRPGPGAAPARCPGRGPRTRGPAGRSRARWP